ncbi:MAG: ABC transporter ATP-binding protein, partial [Acidimicrobiia bacterium]|nr:ABC transporter ATP-binding protein [Acidimicrobiia bacterium]
LMVIVGPSGSGKTSVIRAIAGLDEIEAGSVLFDAQDVTKVEVRERDVGIVFQSHALFPTHSARDNVGFPLKVRSMDKASIRKRVDAEARALGIEQIMERWPRQLSAGHQQLVQIARALVRVPNVLLLDEPMANLDQPTRKRLRQDLKELQRGYGVTTVYATNDPVEAMYMADRIAAIENGRLVQVGTPGEMYARPADVHIAWLTGPISFLDAEVTRDSDGFWLTGDGFRLRAWSPELAGHVGSSVRLGLRPDGLRIEPDSPVVATVVAPSFESGMPVIRVQIGDAVIALREVETDRGAQVRVAIESYLIFAGDGRLVAAV